MPRTAWSTTSTPQYAGRPHGGEVIPRLTAGELDKLRPELSDGTVPKMTGCLHAVQGRVGTARVVDGRIPHSVLLQMFTADGSGTVIVPDPDEPEAPR